MRSAILLSSNAILDRLAKKSFTDKVIFEHTPEEAERMNHIQMKRKQLFIRRKEK